MSIFIVDDDPDDQELVQEALDMAGFEWASRVFSDGEDLLGHLQGGDLPDLILLDLNMPRVDGRTALKIIKEDERLRHIPIVVLTTSRNDDDVRSCYQLGANSFITKPQRFEDLLHCVKTLGEYWTRVARLPNV